MEHDGFGPAGKAGRAGDQGPDRAVLEDQAGRNEVLRFHTVQVGRGGHGLYLSDRAGQGKGEIERVDGLRDQHAAPVARIAAATGFVVVGLRTPPGHGDLHRRDPAERPLGEGF